MLYAASRRLKPLFETHLLIPSNFFSRCPLSYVSSYDCLVDFFDYQPQQCGRLAHPQKLHSRIIVSGAHRSSFWVARLVSVYAGFGLLAPARALFDEMPVEYKSSLLLWNSMIRAYVINGCWKEALSLYARMRRVGILVDGFTLPLVIRACAMTDNLYSNLGRSIHCQSMQLELHCNLHVGNELICMYGKRGQMSVARQVFDRMPTRSQVSWNSMVSGFSRNFDCESAVQMFIRMKSEGIEPNLVTWTSMLSSHARCGQAEETFRLFGEMIRRGIGCNPEAVAVVLSVCADYLPPDKGSILHGFAIKSGCEDHLIVHNALISVYGKHGDIEGAKRIFSDIQAKSIVSWNSLITSYAENGLCIEAYEIFSQLGDSCSEVKPNVVTWSAVIDGFASGGRSEEALELFRRMQLAKVEPNTITVASVLSVCADLAVLDSGREIHGFAIRASMHSNTLVGNSVISMYMKCGNLTGGVRVFDMLDTHRDLVSWNSIIAGYGMHGHGRESIAYFDRMGENGFLPDEVSFTAVLSACSHSGLVHEGRSLFNRIQREFGVEPTIEHYACMVDLLCRFGTLEEASEIVKAMPLEPNVCVWGALLNACRMHRDAGMAEETAAQIFSSGTEMTGSYMLLSNIYASNGRWDDSATVRVSAKEKGLKKVAGQSWIQLNQKVYAFSVGSVSSSADHGLHMGEVYRVLEELTLQMNTSKQLHKHLHRTSYSISVC
ncbi:hypothetical protein SAY86_014542 [Trapa natans]|uniref:Pentatricopeptide repeat-containing protein n=1 Tax=Trapa natans TaxID=22666 RepID=A0AAN7KSV7_TRANT|nr:hypothetical protein SAY86_014542 [Trapa natans]